MTTHFKTNSFLIPSIGNAFISFFLPFSFFIFSLRRFAHVHSFTIRLCRNFVWCGRFGKGESHISVSHPNYKPQKACCAGHFHDLISTGFTAVQLQCYVFESSVHKICFFLDRPNDSCYYPFLAYSISHSTFLKRQHFA